MNSKNLLIKGLALAIIIAFLSSCNLISKNKSDNIILFNGENLEGWKGDVNVWSVEDGCIVGKNTDEYKLKQNTFLIHKNEFSNFELKFQYKIIGGNSGVQYRAKVLDEDLFVVGGYQADMEAGNNYSGILYEEKGRGIIANRGEQVTVLENGEKEVKIFTTSKAIQSKIYNEAWNDYKIVANGNHLQHFINDIKTINVIDKEIGANSNSGVIALQVHTGPNMKVYYKNLEIKIIRH